MHEHAPKGIHEEEVPKLLYTLFWCKPVCWLNVSNMLYWMIISIYKKLQLLKHWQV